MKKSLILIFLIVLISIILVIWAARSQGYYVNRFQPEKLTKAIQNLIFIDVVAMLKDEENPEKKQKSFGIPIGNNYVLVLTHTLIPKFSVKACLPNGYCYTKELEVLAIHYYIGEKEVFLAGVQGDIALLEYKTDKTFPFAFGDFTKARIGDEVLVIGYSFTDFNNIKTGIVSQLNYVWDWDYGPQDMFVITAPVNIGDSGSVVLARWPDGTYEIIGLVGGGAETLQGICLVYPIDHVKNAIKAILNFEFDEF